MRNQLHHCSLFKRLFLWTLVAVTAIAAQATTPHRISYGYCAYEEPSYKTAIGYEEEPTRLGAATLYTSDFLKKFKGDKIVGMRIAVLFDIENVDAFLRHDLDGANMASKTINLKKGWNDIFFDNAITIDDKPIGAGYFFDNLKEKNVIGIQSFGQAQEHGVYISQFGSKFMKYSGGYGSNLMVQLIVECEDEHAQNLLYLNQITSTEYLKKGEPLPIVIGATNYGINNIDNITMVYSYGDGQEIEKTLTKTLHPNETSSWQFTLDNIGNSGMLKCRVIACNGQKLESPFSYEQFTYFYTHNYPRVILQEQFGTERSEITPYAQTDLNYALVDKYKGKVAWIQHHVGFNDDKYTIPESRELLFLFGNPATYNPAMMLNRRIMKGPYTVPTFAVPWTERIQQLYDDELSRPAFASVALSGQFDKSTGEIKLEVKGEIVEENIDTNNFTINIAIVENNLNSTTQAGLEKLGITEYTHQHTLRAMATPMSGATATWQGKQYSYSLDFTLDKSWNADNIVVVGYVAKKLNPNNLADCEIYNATEVALNQLPVSAVASIANDNPLLCHIVDGQLAFNQEIKSYQIFDISGKLVQARSLPLGTYIVRIVDNRGMLHVQKIVVSQF